jgi:hypothetical protein
VHSAQNRVELGRVYVPPYMKLLQASGVDDKLPAHYTTVVLRSSGTAPCLPFDYSEAKSVQYCTICMYHMYHSSSRTTLPLQEMHGASSYIGTGYCNPPPVSSPAPIRAFGPFHPYHIRLRGPYRCSIHNHWTISSGSLIMDVCR